MGSALWQPIGQFALRASVKVNKDVKMSLRKVLWWPCLRRNSLVFASSHLGKSHNNQYAFLDLIPWGKPLGSVHGNYRQGPCPQGACNQVKKRRHKYQTESGNSLGRTSRAWAKMNEWLEWTTRSTWLWGNIWYAVSLETWKSWFKVKQSNQPKTLQFSLLPSEDI